MGEGRDVLDSLFEQFLNYAGVFKDREVLRHDYVPVHLPHRENTAVKFVK